MHSLLAPLAALLVLASLPAAAGCGDGEMQAAACGELALTGGLLSYSDGGAVRWEESQSTAVPYRIVAEGWPALAVSMDGLTPTTWTAAQTLHGFPAMLPQHVDRPLVALAEISPRAIYALPRTVLIGADGAAVFETAAGTLLTPYACASDADCNSTAYIVEASDGDAMYPFGAAPVLSAVDAASGAVAWHSVLPVRQASADVLLLALSATHLVVFAQYDYEVADFFVIERAGGAVTATLPLAGQIAVKLIYPGPSEQPAEITVDDAALQIVLILSAGGFARWSIALADGALTAVPVDAPTARVFEENSNAVGGSGAPGPGSPAFPQDLLPTASGADWRIAALCDIEGRVLVVDSAGARWR